MKVMIATGGTGGHIYPALALAEVIKKEIQDSTIQFWGSNNRMESTVIPEKGYTFFGAPMSGMTAGFNAKVKSAVSIMKAYFLAKKILKREKPDIVIGFGNYISVPMILAASHLHIPVLLDEQNSYAGKATVFLSKKADGIAACYASNYEQMPDCKDKIRLTGNPEATLACETVFDEKLAESYGLKKGVPFVVFMMGSLGSETVSRVIDEACDQFSEDYQVLIATGKANDYTYTSVSNDHIHIVPFIDGKNMLKGCSLAVVRAGATTMSELTALGVPSLLIPSPHVANNHQYYNAMELVKTGAARMIEEKDLTCDNLVSTVNALMHDQKTLEKMHTLALQQGKPRAAYAMVDWIKELVKEC